MSHFLNNFRIYFREYCTSTSIHGFRYFGEKRTIFERVWWLFVFVICLGCCIFSIYTVYKKWEESPVIVTLASKGTPIYDIPFPAITICPESKSSGKKFNFTDMWIKRSRNENITEPENLYLDYMSMVCSNKASKASSNRSTVSQEFFDFLDKIKPAFYVKAYNNNGKMFNCKKNFKPIFTEEGICCSYNLIDRGEMFKEKVVHYKDYQQFQNKSPHWSIDNGYKDDADIEVYPRRALLSGAKNGFSITIITQKSDLDYMCTSVQGYKILLHSPASFPTPSQEYFRLPLDSAVIAEVYPLMTLTSKSLKSYSKDKRTCYFQSERNLEFFNVYNSNNCELECLANYTLDTCGCVSFYMPRDNETGVCNTVKMPCVRIAEKKLQLKNLENKINKRKLKKIGKSQAHCDCLPLCTDLSYDSEMSHTFWDWKLRLAALNLSQFVEHLHVSSLTIYFKTDTFTTSERHEFYGPIDFLANFGGLLGLFTGVSVLSVMEIFYFSSVRILCNKWLYEKWAGNDSQL